MTRQLVELDVLNDLRDLATSLGLNSEGLTNLDAVVAKENLHLFINLMEVAKQRHEVGRQLTEIRMRKYLSNKMVSDNESGLRNADKGL
ncbi:MAG: hypothetical protein QXX51_04055 [Candidatus Bathyarchaeia archaeon]